LEKQQQLVILVFEKKNTDQSMAHQYWQHFFDFEFVPFGNHKMDLSKK